MRSRIEVDVDAPAIRVFELARDVTRWPQLLPHYRKVTVLSRDGDQLAASMHATRAVGPVGIPVRWQSRTWSDDADPDDLKLRFVHTGGATKGMDVTWPPTDEPWGVREFHLRHPDGHTFRVSAGLGEGE